jgi:hypothetical protein
LEKVKQAPVNAGRWADKMTPNITYRNQKGEYIQAIVNGLPWIFSYCPTDGLHICVPHRRSDTKKCVWSAWEQFSRGSLIPFLMENSTELKMILSNQNKPPNQHLHRTAQAGLLLE